MCFALVAAAALPSAAHADEIFGGIHVHDVKTPLDAAGIESGIDFSLGYRGPTVAHLWSGQVQPYIFAAVNSAGNTNYGAAGVSAKFPLGRQIYFRPGLGIAVQTGSAGKFY